MMLLLKNLPSFIQKKFGVGSGNIIGKGVIQDFFTLHLYHKNTKNIILSYLSDLTLVSDRVGIDNPLSRWLRGFICFVQV